MRNFINKKQIIDTISKCQNEFDKNLKNKKVMFVFENKNRTIDMEEIFFPISSFYHLTGIESFDSSNKLLNGYNFYRLLQEGAIDESKIRPKDRTTNLKLQVLPNLMRIDRNASIIGNFTGYSLLLQTDKIIGNVNSCMGFVKDNELNMYVPNTALNKDIRDITNDRKRIICVLKKDINDNLYKNITYLKKNYEISDVLQNKEIAKIIDIENIYSADKSTDKKICDFLYSKNNIELNKDSNESEDTDSEEDER